MTAPTEQEAVIAERLRESRMRGRLWAAQMLGLLAAPSTEQEIRAARILIRYRERVAQATEEAHRALDAMSLDPETMARLHARLRRP